MVTKRLDQDTTVHGEAYKNGALVQHHLVLKTGRDVLAVLDNTAANRHVIHLDMLLMCAQLPHGSTGITIGYRENYKGQALTLFAFTDASYSNWPFIIIDKKPACNAAPGPDPVSHYLPQTT